MKKTAIVLLGTLFAFACKKDNTAPQDPPIDPGPVKTYQPHTMTKETYSTSRWPNSVFTYSTLTYDGQGRMIHRQDNGSPTYHYYFTFPNETSYTSEVLADTLVIDREYGIQVNGRLDSVIRISQYDINDTTGSTKYIYDGLGKLKSEAFYQKSGSDWIPSSKFNYEYDTKGNLSKFIGPYDSTRYFYDLNKKNTLAPIMPFQLTNPYLITREIYYEYGHPSQTIDHRYGFDVVGKIISDTSEFRSSGDRLIYSYTY